MSWPISQNSPNADERTFDFRLRDATDLVTPENVTPGDIVCTVHYADGSNDTLSTACTAIDAAKGLYRGSFTQAESNFPGNATVVATCAGCADEPIPVTILPGVFDPPAEPEDVAAACRDDALQLLADGMELGDTTWTLKNSANETVTITISRVAKNAIATTAATP